MNPSLRARLLFAHGVVVVGAIVALALLEVGTQRRWLVQRANEELQRVARTLTSTLPASAATDLGRTAAVRAVDLSG